MAKVVSAVLMIIGLALGATIYFPSLRDREAPFAALTGMKSAAPAETGTTASPLRNRVAWVDGPDIRLAWEGVEAAPAARRDRADDARPAPTASAVTATWRPVVTAAPGAGDGSTSPAPIAPATEEARWRLALDLQRELKRVGCYWGRLDGSWGKGSKQAMIEFMDRVNAQLPFDRPDYILLSLIQNQPAGICAGSCPKGQSLTNAGRCVPNAILAQADRKSGRAPRVDKPGARQPFATGEAEIATAALAAQSARPDGAAGRRTELPGRMSIGGPLPATAAAADPSAAASDDTADRAAQSERSAALSLQNELAGAPADGTLSDPAGAPQDWAAPAPVPRGLRAPPSRRDAKAAKPARSAAAKRSRSVQNMFRHPLGSM